MMRASQLCWSWRPRFQRRRRAASTERRPGRGLRRLAQDARYAVRGMRRDPGFTAVVVLSLALGIGANTTMFSAIDALLLKPPAHVRDPDRIHRLYFAEPGPDGGMQPWPAEGYSTYTALRDRARGFESVAALRSAPVSSGRGAEARRYDALLVTPSFFPLLGVQPALGRFFAPNEERDDGDHVAVLGYHTWRARFGGDSAVIGRSVDVGGVPHVVVGVAPRGFTGIDLERVDLWLPLGVARRLLNPTVLDANAGGYWLSIVGKARPNVSDAQLSSEATQVYHDVHRDDPNFEERYANVRALVGPIIAGRGPARDADAKVSGWVAAMSILVLLIACANVANLLLLRGLARAQETAVRLSLGASRWRLIQQSLTEGGMLALAGGVGALAVAGWSASAVRAFLIPKAPQAATLLDPRLLVFTAAVTLGTGVAAALAPAFANARGRIGLALRIGRKGDGASRLVAQRALITAQVSLAMFLLVGAGLFVLSLRNVRAIDLGVDVDRLLYVKVDVGAAGVKGSDDNATDRRPFDAMLDRVRGLPGVRSVSLSAGEPLTSAWGLGLRRLGEPDIAPGSPAPMARAVGVDYFETVGTRLVRGRVFGRADHAPDARVAIVDEATARAYWPAGDAVGACALLGSDSLCTEIVGIVATTVQWDITGDRGRIVYLPIEAWPDQRVSMLQVRAAGDPSALIVAVRQALASMSSEMPWVEVRPVSDYLEPQLRPWRLGAWMFTAFGVLALGLAAMGLYGVVSYSVAQRAHEIGIRKALGASDGGTLRMVLGRAVRMAALGVAAGALVASWSGGFVAQHLYGISARDPGVFAACAGVLVLVAIAASLVPARRATRVDPMTALRTE